jgi:signal transduction histidine kinase
MPPSRRKHPRKQKSLISESPWYRRDSSRGYSQLRPTIRIRLTLLYGGMFLIAGTALLAITYLLIARALRNTGASVQINVYDAKLYSDVCPEFSQARSISEFNSIANACLDNQRATALNSFLHRSLWFLLALTVLAFTLGYILAGRVLSPLSRITRLVHSVAGSGLDKRIELDGPEDELKELADTFDDMLDRLNRAFTAQQRFVSNASHELRTPLAINRTLLEVQMSDPRASPELTFLGKSLLAMNERSEQLVEGLLLLARSENEISERKPIDLAEAASYAVEQVRAEADASGVELRGERQRAYTQGNGVLLERLTQNLLQNAVRYNTPTDGWVEVTTSARPGHVLLIVSNTGPVVPAYEVDSLFEPFKRLRTERMAGDNGAGLGLSIVRSVTRAHGGAVTAVPRVGGGLEIHVRLPAGGSPNRSGSDATRS